jgi:hypothetical protein
MFLPSELQINKNCNVIPMEEKTMHAKYREKTARQ